jgi:hypothetical protein
VILEVRDSKCRGAIPKDVGYTTRKVPMLGRRLGHYEILEKVSAIGGSPSVVSTPDRKQGEIGHAEAEILPDGKTVLFTIMTTEGCLHDSEGATDADPYRAELV